MLENIFTWQSSLDPLPLAGPHAPPPDILDDEGGAVLQPQEVAGGRGRGRGRHAVGLGRGEHRVWVTVICSRQNYLSQAQLAICIYKCVGTCVRMPRLTELDWGVAATGARAQLGPTPATAASGPLIGGEVAGRPVIGRDGCAERMEPRRWLSGTGSRSGVQITQSSSSLLSSSSSGQWPSGPSQLCHHGGSATNYWWPATGRAPDTSHSSDKHFACKGAK